LLVSLEPDDESDFEEESEFEEESDFEDESDFELPSSDFEPPSLAGFAAEPFFA
jgi:hypothetical protein